MKFAQTDPSFAIPHARYLAFIGKIRASYRKRDLILGAILIDLKAVALACGIFGLFLLDYVTNTGAVFLFLGKKLFDLIAFIEFWH